ncbi:MAG TPA: DUF1080 domain-containing protein [Candidatus Hydrogenedentes bacterium]|nr:DUF1080 domain-containing protein [Candidatus Hydrogenedentota bacterium]
MRSLCARALLLAMAVAVMPGAVAQEGWIDLFDGETLFGWQQLGNLEWQVENGAMACKHVRGAAGWIATTSVFADFELSAKIRVGDGGSTAVAVRAGLDGHPSENGASWITLSEPERSKPAFRDVAITAKGDSVTATVDGQSVEIQGGGAACGHVGVLYHCSGKIEVQEMKLRPLDMTPIFNGKDLEGWNVIPDHASVFSVVDGAINIKNGNGQIETANVYRDFVLQMSIFSNGDHLNSGVFFRGPVGEFWRGYESQVRNEWRQDDRTKPVDFGTGGIYGDQEARKVMSSDREWFEKTLVCHGNHMAVWINGHQVSDWLDMRLVSESWNGKEGYVPGPGTIHLQGHDPTTDLSFKDIRIQTYPTE